MFTPKTIKRPPTIAIINPTAAPCIQKGPSAALPAINAIPRASTNRPATATKTPTIATSTWHLDVSSGRILALQYQRPSARSDPPPNARNNTVPPHTRPGANSSRLRNRKPSKLPSEESSPGAKGGGVGLMIRGVIWGSKVNCAAGPLASASADGRTAKPAIAPNIVRNTTSDPARSHGFVFHFLTNVIVSSWLITSILWTSIRKSRGVLAPGASRVVWQPSV